MDEQLTPLPKLSDVAHDVVAPREPSGFWLWFGLLGAVLSAGSILVYTWPSIIVDAFLVAYPVYAAAMIARLVRWRYCWWLAAVWLAIAWPPLAWNLRVAITTQISPVPSTTSEQFGVLFGLKLIIFVPLSALLCWLLFGRLWNTNLDPNEKPADLFTAIFWTALSIFLPMCVLIVHFKLEALGGHD